MGARSVISNRRSVFAEMTNGYSEVEQARESFKNYWEYCLPIRVTIVTTS